MNTWRSYGPFAPTGLQDLPEPEYVEFRELDIFDQFTFPNRSEIWEKMDETRAFNIRDGSEIEVGVCTDVER